MTGTILIVDDEPTAVDTMEATFLGEGHTLVFANNGELAIQKANEILPDLILLDVMMPGMDGFEVCQRLRAAPKLAEVPILLLTALDDRQSRLTGIKAGADDFFTKPVDRQELRLRVRTILRLNRYRTLLIQRENLQTMARHVVTAQEEERKRISRELHDELGQALIAHVLNLNTLQAGLPAENHPSLDMLINETNQILNQMRMLAQDLRPALLDTLGLKNALETYCNEFKSRSGLKVSFEADPNLPEIPDVYSITLYRFLQETLTNVIKHSSANQVWVELAMDEREITLTVQDNGIGISGITSSNKKGIGITGLRERLMIVGGELRVNSNPSNGTIVTAHLPVEAVTNTGD